MSSLSTLVWAFSIFLRFVKSEGEQEIANYRNVHCTTYYDREETWPISTSYDAYTIYPPMLVTLTATPTSTITPDIVYITSTYWVTDYHTTTLTETSGTVTITDTSTNTETSTSTETLTSVVWITSIDIITPTTVVSTSATFTPFSDIVKTNGGFPRIVPETTEASSTLTRLLQAASTGLQVAEAHAGNHVRDVGVQNNTASKPRREVAGILGCKSCYPAEVCCTATYTEWVATTTIIWADTTATQALPTRTDVQSAWVTTTSYITTWSNIDATTHTDTATTTTDVTITTYPMTTQSTTTITAIGPASTIYQMCQKQNLISHYNGQKYFEGFDGSGLTSVSGINDAEGCCQHCADNEPACKGSIWIDQASQCLEKTVNDNVCNNASPLPIGIATCGEDGDTPMVFSDGNCGNWGLDHFSC